MTACGKSGRHSARFWPLTRGDRKWLLLIVACVIVSALAETASILLFAELTDHALKAGSLAAFWGPAGAWLGVAVLGAVVGYLGNSLAVWTAERFVLRLRASVFRHVQDLPPHFFQKHRQGDLVERLTGDVEAIEQMVVSGVVGTVSAVFSAALLLRRRPLDPLGPRPGHLPPRPPLPRRGPPLRRPDQDRRPGRAHRRRRDHLGGRGVTRQRRAHPGLQPPPRRGEAPRP